MIRHELCCTLRKHALRQDLQSFCLYEVVSAFIDHLQRLQIRTYFYYDEIIRSTADHVSSLSTMPSGFDSYTLKTTNAR